MSAAEATATLPRPRQAPAATRDRRAALRLAAAQVRYEVLGYVRNRRRMFFTFALPVMFLVIFSALYGNDPVKEFGGRRLLTFFIPGILSYGVIMATFVSVVAAITRLRHDGVLKRVRGTPVPTWVYLAGHVGCAAFAAAAITVITLVIGSLYGVSVPWHALPGIATAVAGGAAAFTALGFGVTQFARDPDSAPMLGNFTILPLTFISGVWGPPVTDHTLKQIADVFPVRMLADALQHAYDPAVHGAAVSGGDLLGLAIWGLVGLRLTQRLLRREAADG
jgi:ABC-2 type transport system permease protein